MRRRCAPPRALPLTIRLPYARACMRTDNDRYVRGTGAKGSPKRTHWAYHDDSV